MRKLAHVLPEALERPEILRAAKAQRILRHWPEIVGSALAERSQPDRYDHGTVWISVAGSAWAQELRMHTPKLLARIAELAGDPDLVRELRFGVRQPRELVDTALPGPRLPVDPAIADLSIREIAQRRLSRWPDDEGTGT